MECGYGTIWRILIKSVGSLSYLDHGKLINFIGSYRFLYIYSNFDALLNNLLRVLLVTKSYVIALLSTKPVLVETYLFLFCYVIYLSIEHSFLILVYRKTCIGACHCLFLECFNAILLACFRNIWKECINRLFDRKDSSSLLF